MRFIVPLVLAAAAALAGCEGTPTDTEQPPAADAPVGEASAGIVVGETDVEEAHFGEAFTVTESIKVKDLLDDPASYASENPILVEGTVVDVCQKAGCWMVVSDGSRQMRVTMKEHGFAVDKQGTGSWARIQGTLHDVTPDPDTVAHIEGESEKPDLMPEKTGQTWQMTATGVTFKKSS